ncbi:MAG: preprotein translocase subunit SecG [Rhizobiaceae bacterium]
MTTVLITVHIMLVLALIVLVLLQRSEGGALGMGGGGGGGGGGLMSARGAANALTKTTSIIAAGFFLTSIALGVVANRENRTEDVLRQVEGAAKTGVPTDGAGAKTPSAGGLLDELQKQDDKAAPASGVPTSE